MAKYDRIADSDGVYKTSLCIFKYEAFIHVRFRSFIPHHTSPWDERITHIHIHTNIFLHIISTLSLPFSCLDDS